MFVYLFRLRATTTTQNLNPKPPQSSEKQPPLNENSARRGVQSCTEPATPQTTTTFLRSRTRCLGRRVGSVRGQTQGFRSTRGYQSTSAQDVSYKIAGLNQA